jgi:MFS family permease
MRGAGRPRSQCWSPSQAAGRRLAPRGGRQTRVKVLRQLLRLSDLGRRAPRRVAFAGVFAVTLTAFLGVGVVLPVLPRYVRDHLGAGDVAVGVVMGAFALTAIVVRPIAGRMADVRARRPVVLAGLCATAVGGLLYFLPFGVPGLVLARLVLGAGDGVVFTAGVSWAVDLAPADRRGQAIGLFGLAVWGGLSAGPLIGSAALDLGGYGAAFALAALFPLVGVAIAARLPDQRVGAAAPPGPRGPLIPDGVLAPGVALALANVGYGTMAGFVVLMLADRGVDGGAAVFTAFAVAVVGSRLLLARLPDRVGASATALGAGVGEGLGLVLMAQASSMAFAVLAAVVMGIGFSLLFPSLALLALVRADEQRRATAMGAFTAFFDLGFGLGAPLAGAVAALTSYTTAFTCAGVAAAVGVVLGVIASHGGRGGGDHLDAPMPA